MVVFGSTIDAPCPGSVIIGVLFSLSVNRGWVRYGVRQEDRAEYLEVRTKRAFSRLRMMIRMAYLLDGIHSEESSGYHLFLCWGRQIIFWARSFSYQMTKAKT